MLEESSKLVNSQNVSFENNDQNRLMFIYLYNFIFFLKKKKGKQFKKLKIIQQKQIKLLNHNPKCC